MSQSEYTVTPIFACRTRNPGRVEVHEFYAILANREAVNLVAIVSPMQRLCNLNMAGADAIFVSDLTTNFNPLGMKNLQEYRDVSTDVLTDSRAEGLAQTALVLVDHEKLINSLEDTNYDCRRFLHHPAP